MLLIALVTLASTPAGAKTICTIVADAASGVVLLEEGDCHSRVTPASTFKIPLSLMGFDAGYLRSLDSPVIPFEAGYPDWGGDNWTQATDPQRWMKYSVLWYSHHITAALGIDGLAAYTRRFGYGNADLSGDPGKNNALTRAWISSSLKIAPVEQVGFLRRLLDRTLPVAPFAMEQTLALVETVSAGDGWEISGKTGAAYPRRADGNFDRARGWGWFVGWATRGDRTLVFARLDQDEMRLKGSPGNRNKEAFLEEWPQLMARIR